MRTGWFPELRYELRETPAIGVGWIDMESPRFARCVRRPGYFRQVFWGVAQVTAGLFRKAREF